MKISATKEELAILILALRTFSAANYESRMIKLQNRLRRRLEKELLTKHGVIIKSSNS